jgi:hypothetical protein
MIRQETSFQAILATSLSQVRSILAHLRCDLFLLTDPTFPEEDLERLYLLPEGVEAPAWLSVAFLSWTYNYRDPTSIKSVVKAVNLLLTVRDSPLGVLSEVTPLCRSRELCERERLRLAD